jgi:hypothetical protein
MNEEFERMGRIRAEEQRADDDNRADYGKAPLSPRVAHRGLRGYLE